MSVNPFDIKGPRTFEPPPGYIETDEARRYWGDLLPSHGGLNPRLCSLIAAIVDFARLAHPVETPPITDHTHAFPVVMPETFGRVLALFKIEEPEYGPAEAVASFGHDVFDAIFSAYYTSLHLPVTLATRAGGAGANQRLPLVQRKTVHLWLRKYIAACPSEFWNRINVLLRDAPALLDPVTEEPFVHRVIPRSCFPAEGAVPGAYDAIIQEIAEFQTKADVLVKEARPRPQQGGGQDLSEELAVSQQMYQTQVMLANQQKEYYRDMLGGWKTDEYGNRTYVEGWM